MKKIKYNPQGLGILNEALKKEGYEAKMSADPSANFFEVKTKNRIKVEWKFIDSKPIIVLAYGSKDEVLESLKEHFLQKGEKILTVEEMKRKTTKPIPADHKCVKLELRNLDHFTIVVKDIENIDGIIANRRKQGRQLFPKKYDPMKIAKRYINAISTDDQEMLDDHRRMLDADVHKNVFALNEKTEELNYGEHPVPCIALHNKCCDMAIAGESVIAIANLIKKNLLLVYIREDDATKLNTELGLKTDMPKGWEWGMDPLARIKDNNIKY